MDVLWQDLRYASRALVKNRTFTLPAILSLALGIGATTTIFTFIHAVFLHPLEVREPSELAAVFSRTFEEPGLLGVSHPNYVDYREKNRIFSDLAAARWVSVHLETDEGPQRIFGEIVTSNYFEVLGVEAAAGRNFLSKDGEVPGSDPSVVLSHSLWQRHFGGDPAVVGRSLRISGHPFTVVGVAQRSFQGLNLLQGPDLWVPMRMHREILVGGAARLFDRRDGNLLDVIGRLQPGIDTRQAGPAMEVLTRNLVRAHPDKNRGLGVAVEPLVEQVVPESFRRRFVLAGGLFMGAVGLLLVIACVNVANLLLGRGLGRRRETAIRLALGSGRGRLGQQLLTEGLLLTLVGGVAGLLVAVFGRELLWELRPFYLPDTLDLSFAPTIVGFTLALTLLIGVVFSLAPIAKSWRLDLSSELKERGGGLPGGGLRTKGVLVTTQVTLSVVILFGAGLFTRSLGELREVDPGFETESLFLIPVAIGSQGYSQTEGLEFYRRTAERISALGGVEAAAVSARPVLAPGGGKTVLEAEDPEVRERAAGVLVHYNMVGTGYFETLRLSLLEGRVFDATDRQGSRGVIVVNQTMADWLWPGQSAIGREVLIEDEELPTEVIGVVEDAKHGSLAETARPYFYLPVEQHYMPSMILHVRTSTSPQAVSLLVRQEIHALEPKLPLLETRFVEQLVDNSLWAARVTAGLLGFFSLLALVLAAVGLYGVLAYSVHLRHREIGVRMAMGANRGDVLRLVAWQGMTMVGVGVGVGIVLSVAASYAVADLLFEVSPFDPATVAGTLLVLSATGLAAVSMPARRAATIHPMRVLREE